MSSLVHFSASPFSRLAQASHLLGKVIRHCNDETQNLQAAQEEVETLYQSITTLLALLNKDAQSTLRFQNAVAICLRFVFTLNMFADSLSSLVTHSNSSIIKPSALMKLADQHSCETFATRGREVLDMDTMTLARNITVRCRDIMDATIGHILFLVEKISKTGHLMTLGERRPGASPLVLHCIYRAIVAQSWMASATSPDISHKYAPGKLLCIELLQQANLRWKAAGLSLIRNEPY